LPVRLSFLNREQKSVEHLNWWAEISDVPIIFSSQGRRLTTNCNCIQPCGCISLNLIPKAWLHVKHETCTQKCFGAYNIVAVMFCAWSGLSHVRLRTRLSYDEALRRLHRRTHSAQRSLAPYDFRVALASPAMGHWGTSPPRLPASYFGDHSLYRL